MNPLYVCEFHTLRRNWGLEETNDPRRRRRKRPSLLLGWVRGEVNAHEHVAALGGKRCTDSSLVRARLTPVDEAE